MKTEIESAANFLQNLLRLNSNFVGDSELEVFRDSLLSALSCYYKEHWFPDKPNKGSGYRCIRINHKMDPVIAKAGLTCGLDEASLKNLLPNELTLWIDPKEVSYRIGENGSICVLYDAESNEIKPEASREGIPRSTPTKKPLTVNSGNDNNNNNNDNNNNDNNNNTINENNNNDNNINNNNNLNNVPSSLSSPSTHSSPHLSSSPDCSIPSSVSYRGVTSFPIVTGLSSSEMNRGYSFNNIALANCRSVSNGSHFGDGWNTNYRWQHQRVDNFAHPPYHPPAQYQYQRRQQPQSSQLVTSLHYSKSPSPHDPYTSWEPYLLDNSVGGRHGGHNNLEQLAAYVSS